MKLNVTVADKVELQKKLVRHYEEGLYVMEDPEHYRHGLVFLVIATPEDKVYALCLVDMDTMLNETSNVKMRRLPVDTPVTISNTK